jgi:glycosyltransferase involved in cell wall biosynthesis
MCPKVIVVMATFNGQKYISEQITSILGQKFVSVELHIFDDGSDQSNINLLKSFESEKIFLHFDSERKGPQFRYLHALKDFGYAEFVSWADQDDIWDPNKIHVAIEAIQGLNLPALYCSNVDIYDNLKQNSISGLMQRTHYSLPQFPLSVFENSAMGCTIVLNKKSVELLTKCFDSKIIMHDWFALLVVLTCGQVVFDFNSHMKYRIHDMQAVGFRRRKRFRSIFGFSHIHSALEQANFVWDNYRSVMDATMITEFSLFLTTLSSPRLSTRRFSYLCSRDRKFRSSVVGHCLFVAKLLLIPIAKR